MSDVGRIAVSLAGAMRHLANGEMAALRRLDPEAATPAYWRLAARHEELDRDCDRWASVVQALAILTPKGPSGERPELHDRRRPFGFALCDGGDPGWPGTGAARPCLSERRLAQLLAARGEQRRTLLIRAVRAVATRRDPGLGLDVADLAWAFLNPANAGAIAGPYYRRLDPAQRRADEATQPEAEDA